MADAKPAAEEAAKPPVYVAKPDGADPFATHLVDEKPHHRGLLACRYTPDGRFVFAGAHDYLIHRWDLSIVPEPVPEEPVDPKKPKPKKPVVKKGTPPPRDPIVDPSRIDMAGHESWVRAMSVFPDGKRLVTGDYVGRVIVWPATVDAPQPALSIAAHEGSVRAVSASPDGKLIASAGNDGMVRIWNADGPEKLVHELAGHECHVYNVAFHPDGKSLLSADLKGVMKHWDVATGKLVRELDASALHTYSVKYTVDVGGVRGMSFNAEGTRLACAGAVGDKGIAHSGSARVLLFDWASGKLLQELKPAKEEILTAWSVRFHPDGFIVASGGSRTGGFLWFWVPEQDVAFHALKFKQRAPGFDVDISPDGKTLAVANHDGTLRLYAMSKPEEKAEPKKA